MITKSRPLVEPIAEMRIAIEIPIFYAGVIHVYEVPPRKDKGGVDLVSVSLPFGRLWYGEPNAIRYAKLSVWGPEGTVAPARREIVLG